MKRGSLRGFLGVLIRLLILSAASAEAAVLVSTNTAWRYARGTQEASSPVSFWREPAFSDSAWTAGYAPFSFGESLTGTLLSDMQNR